MNLAPFFAGRPYRHQRLSHEFLIGLLLVVLSLCSITQAQDLRDTLAPAKYDRRTLFTHMNYLFDVENLEQDPVFVRWERPVRYHLQVPPGHPELVTLFERQVAQIAQYTGLDIARHDALYPEYQNEALNERHKWPQGLSTNALVILTFDMEKTLQEPGVVTKLGDFGKRWSSKGIEQLRQIKETKQPTTMVYSHGLSSDGLRFSLLAFELKKNNINSNHLSSTTHVEIDLLRIAFDLVTRLRTNDTLPSIMNSYAYKKGLRGLTEFDKQLLRAYYSNEVKSGMHKLDAILLMNEALVRHFAAAQTKNAGR